MSDINGSLSRKETIRRAAAMIENANEQLRAARVEKTGMLQIIAHLIGKCGGCVTVTGKELGEIAGALGMAYDETNDTWTLELLVPKAQATATMSQIDVLPGAPNAVVEGSEA